MSPSKVAQASVYLSPPMTPVAKQDALVKVVLRFRMKYKTNFGENLVICGSIPGLGAIDNPSPTEAVACVEDQRGARMRYINDDVWGFDMALELNPKTSPTFWYRYVVVEENNHHPPIAERGPKKGRLAILSGEVSGFPAVMDFQDTWRGASGESSIFLTAAFRDVIFHDPARLKDKSTALVKSSNGEAKVTVRLTFENARVETGHVMGVIGSASALGGWEDGKVAVMSGANYPIWQLDVEVAESELPMEYRYCIVEARTKKILAVEQGDPSHRVEFSREAIEDGCAESGVPNPKKMMVLTDGVDPTVNDLPLFGREWRGAGVAVPVFGLRSEQGAGIGEFADLKGLVDWCNKAGMKMIQLLPVTDTTAHVPTDHRDSYPYSSISVYALHPMYLRMGDIPGISSGLKAEIQRETKRLNAEDYYKEAQWDQDLNTELHRPVDFPAVMKVKNDIMRKAFKEIGQKMLESQGFKDWFAKAEFWVRPYGLFCKLRDFFGTANHEEWGALGMGRVSYDKMMEMTAADSEFYSGISYYWFAQYILHLQLLDASEYAAKHSVVLKGDLPIGVDRNSCDAWFEPAQFHMNKKTGAPPDDYADQGQNWGFPTYNWAQMEKDGYRWWRSRLGWMSNYFHAYRIDHILGFFRIWEMPATATGGLLGRFRPSLPITRDELRSVNLEGAIDRLCEPWICKHHMEGIFGNDWGRVKDRFMDESYGRFRFKQGLCSEVEIERIVNAEGSCLGYRTNEQLIASLNTLVNNVVLLRDDEKPNDCFYPRIEMWKSSSFMELDGGQQHSLRTLYQSYFYGRQDQYWADTAMKKLPPLLDSSDMLVCGEDLGMIPACVKGVLEQLVIMGLKIQRMPAPGESAGAFGTPDKYPHMSVCTPSCHDMSTVAGWWEEDGGRRQTFWNSMLQRGDGAPEQCTPEIAEMIFKQHVWSPSCWAVFPIQDILQLDDKMRSGNPKGDQINWPPNPKHYWRWRSRVSNEELLSRGDFAGRIREMLDQSGRTGGY